MHSETGKKILTSTYKFSNWILSLLQVLKHDANSLKAETGTGLLDDLSVLLALL